jgi:flagellar L-ring protein precursor FlgH
MKSPLALLVVLALSGCAANAVKEPRDEPAPVPAIAPKTEGAIYQTTHEFSLFADTRARQVGDIITVVLVEKTAAKKSAATSANKDASADIAMPKIMGYDIARGEAAIDASRKFTGGGDSSQSNQLDGNITVTVIERLASGNLRVKGEKQLTINQGDELVRLTGIIRPADIAPDNSILSSRVADARISYVGKGALADSNAQGWVSRILNSAWWPF